MELNKAAIELAAQCWCDPETSDRVMDEALAMAFAKRLSPLLDKVQWYECPESVRYAVRRYGELSSEDQLKIDNLMRALTECRA